MSLPFDKPELSLAREIPFGAFRSSTISYPSNRIVTRKFTWVGFLPEVMTQLFRNSGYLWLLIVCAADAVLLKEEERSGDVSTIVIFGLAVLFVGTREALLEFHRISTDRGTNSVPCRVWNGQGFVEVPCGEVLCGDLLLVSNGESLVADAVLFTTEHPDGLCYVDSSQTLGSAEMSLKQAVPDVQRFVESSSVERVASVLPKVQGLIRTEIPNQDFKSFHGQLKLTKSPAAVPLTMDNFILRGSRVFAAAWVVCCVVGTGMETKVMLNSISSLRSISRFEFSVSKFSILAIILSLLLILTNIIGYFLSTHPEANSALLTFFKSISLFHRVMPAMVYFLFHLTRFLQTKLVNYSSACKGKITVNPLVPTAPCGEIDYIVADKNCAFTVSRPNVHTIVYRDKLFSRCPGYDSGEHSCTEIVRRQRNKEAVRLGRRQSFSSPNEHTFASSKSLSKQPEEVKDSCGFRSLEAQMSLGESEDLIKMFECMVLCNTIAQLEPLKAKNKFEEALVVGAHRFGFKVLESAGDRILLEIAETRVVYQIIASSEYNKVSKRVRAIISRPDSTGNLFVKGSIEVLGPLLAIEEEMFDRIRAAELELKQQGLVPIMLACKSITEEELETVKDKVWKAQASAFNVQNRIETVFSELESNLQYLGIVCVEDTIPVDTNEGVSKLLKAGIKLWIVGNDSETESLASCMRSGFFDDDNYIVPIKDLTESRDCARRLSNLVTEFVYKKPICSGWTEEASALLTPKTQRVAPSLERLMSEIVFAENTTRRTVYKELLKHSFDPQALNFMILIDGTSFETALKEEESQRLMAALLFTAKVVCMFSTLPHQKAKIVRFLKHSFSFSPAVLTFADGLSSIPMLNEADIRVGLERATSEQSYYLFDAKVKSLNALADFLITAGRGASHGLREVLMLVLHENVMVVTVMIVYAGLCGFTANSPVDSYSVWAVTTIATKPLMLYIALFSRDIDYMDAIELPEVYRWRTQPYPLRTIILFAIVIPFIYGIFIAFISLIDLKATINPIGSTENSLSLTGSVSVLLFLSISGHIMVKSRQSLQLWVALLVSCCLFALETTLFTYTDIELLAYLSMTFSFPSLLFRIFPGAMFVSALSLAVRLYIEVFTMPLRKYIETESGRSARVREFEMDLGKVWVRSKVWAPPKSSDMFERRNIWRTYKISSMESSFEINFFPEIIRHIQASYLIATLLTFSCTAAAISSDSTPEFHPLRIIFSVFCLSLLAISFTNWYRDRYIFVNKIGILVLSFSLGLYEILSGNSHSEIAITLPILFFLAFYISFAEVVLVTVINFIAYLIIGVFNIFIQNDDSSQGVLQLLNFSFDVAGVTFTSALAGYFLNNISREKFRLLSTKESELEKADNILKYLLPEFVRARVKDGVRFIAEVQPCVHILFCEICKFDHMIKDYEAVEVTGLLNNIYEKFDELCETCGVTKVETVGKVYMACVGVKESDRQEIQSSEELAQKMLHFAFEILSAIEQFRLADGEPVKIKIGMHSGQVIAGVVGYHKPQFSLVGDTVNTASRMCSTVDEENSIQISSATFELLKDTYGVLFECKEKEIKGKGRMAVYTVWKDIGSRSFRREINTPDISPELPKHSSKSATAVVRGVTMGRRNSVFEASSGVFKAMNQNTSQRRFWKLFNFKLINSKYYHEILHLRHPVAVMGLFSIFILTLLDVGLEASDYSLGFSQRESLITRCVACALLFALALLSQKIFTLKCFSWVAMCFLSGATFCYFSDLQANQNARKLSTGMSMMVLMVLAAVHFTGMRSFQLLPYIVLTAGLCIGLFLEVDESMEIELRVGCVLGELLVFFVYVLYRDVRLEKYFELKQAVTTEISKTDKLLENLLPQHILNSMKLERAITDHLQDTTLLVADIVGFTAWSNDREPSEVIELLSNLFSAFDKLCLKFKTYKVYTIGDCYIAMGFSGTMENRNPRQECVNVVLMAKDMKKVIEQVNDDYFTSLNMRIGVHTGEIIGAMVGTNIVRYDIYGQDVLIAFKMEANSRPGLINVSESSRRFLEDTEPEMFSYKENCVVDISAIGAKVKCYFTDVRKE